MTRKKLKKGSLAARQQDAVNTIKAMRDGLEQLIEGPYVDAPITTRTADGWFPDHDFASGQISVMLGTASEKLDEALAAFVDCAEDGVEVPQR